MTIRKIAQLRTADALRRYLRSSSIDLEFDEMVEVGSRAPLAQPYFLRDGLTIGNRFCVQPMEGWDGTADGRPSELTFRRWRNFGRSGAKLIWGGEAAAVRHDGRANPNQLLLNSQNLPDFILLRQELVQAHVADFGSSADLLIGLQLTHSGRFARPNSKTLLEPTIAYHHPYLDQKFHLPPDFPIISDEEVWLLIQDFIEAARLAKQAGFDFVDIKHCHGYLGHELLSAHSRPGSFGGSFENRTRFLKEVVAGIRQEVPGLRIGVRLSAFDTLPFEPDPQTRIGRPAVPAAYPFAFGANPQNALEMQLDEPFRFLELLEKLEIELVNVTAGSPYYNPHIQRPAYFPPSDGYLPPEDPLAGVARHIHLTAALKQHAPNCLIVGTGYSCLQEWLPHVAQHTVRSGGADFVGLGRMILSYPEFPADILAGRPYNRQRICRTFSDCTTAPRLGLVSGCFPLDDHYRSSAEAALLAEKKSMGKRQP